MKPIENVNFQISFPQYLLLYSEKETANYILKATPKYIVINNIDFFFLN